MNQWRIHQDSRIETMNHNLITDGGIVTNFALQTFVERIFVNDSLVFCSKENQIRNNRSMYYEDHISGKRSNTPTVL